MSASPLRHDDCTTVFQGRRPPAADRSSRDPPRSGSPRRFPRACPRGPRASAAPSPCARAPRSCRTSANASLDTTSALWFRYTSACTATTKSLFMVHPSPSQARIRASARRQDPAFEPCSRRRGSPRIVEPITVLVFYTVFSVPMPDTVCASTGYPRTGCAEPAPLPLPEQLALQAGEDGRPRRRVRQMDEARFEVEQLLGGNHRVPPQGSPSGRHRRTSCTARSRLRRTPGSCPLLFGFDIALRKGARRAEHRAHAAGAARLGVDADGAEQARVDLRRHRRPQAVHGVEHAHAPLRIELGNVPESDMRSRSRSVGAPSFVFNATTSTVFSAASLARDCACAKNPRRDAPRQAALVFQQDLIGELRRAEHADVAALRGHEVVGGSHRGVDARHVRPEPARRTCRRPA